MFDLALAPKAPGGAIPVRETPGRPAHAAASRTQNTPAVVIDLADRPAEPATDLVGSFRRTALAARLWRAEIDKAVEDASRLIRALAADGDPVAQRVTDADIETLRVQLRESFAQPAVRLTHTRMELRIEGVEMRLNDGSDQVAVSFQRISLQASVTELTINPALQARQEDPLILDLDGDGVDLAPKARRFDLDGDGSEETVTWVRGDDALLALDRDGDGRISSGKELFGDQHGAVDGFAELAKFDDDGNGVVDRNDSVWGSLVVLRATGDMATLEEVGVTSIRFDLVRRLDQDVTGGRLVSAGSYTTKSGQVGSVVDALFDVSV